MKIASAALVVLAFTSIAPGCSVYMEVTRPEPVNLNDFQPGMSRDMVFGKIGAPDSSEPEADGDRCDYYRLYTRGYGAGGKVPIALAESAADFFTVGLAEVALTPTEALTRNEKHPVTLCYKNQTLARIGGGVSAGTPLDQNGNSIADTSAAPTAQSAPAPAPAENNN